MKGNSSANSKELVHAMNSRIAHRGPDDEGVWSSIDNQLHFGHRRLSIIDLSPSGHQPMIDEQGNAIVFNGEIYNYKELKSELKPSSYFKTESDTEVILELYKKIWSRCFKKVEWHVCFCLLEPTK
ncbi:MAG: hypothetical protein IPK10_11690 [Bacteroidetes bacterium]|nr:hypothetical protein [Bacteroidota bacterium]